jgi:hypothetical protein
MIFPVEVERISWERKTVLKYYLHEFRLIDIQEC